jgi:hypothetical protein
MSFSIKGDCLKSLLKIQFGHLWVLVSQPSFVDVILPALALSWFAKPLSRAVQPILILAWPQWHYS